MELQLSAEDEKYYDDLINEIFEGQDLTKVILDEKALQKTIKNLTKGVTTGYETIISQPDYTTKDVEFIGKLKTNVYEFSAAKNYVQMKAMNEALMDGDRVKSFDEFKRDAMVLLKTFNVNYLKSEYNRAIACSQMAAKWNSFPEGAMLKRVSAEDERVREPHVLLNGICRPKDDEFWISYYPPGEEWGCRCDVVETMNEATDLTDIELPNPTGYNVGIVAQIYKKSSGFFKETPAEVIADYLKRIEKLTTKND